MLHLDEELVKSYQQRMIEQAETVRMLQQNRSTTPSIADRLLLGAGDYLISLGLRVKNLSQTADEQDYSPLYT
jgi:hypothetical protein